MLGLKRKIITLALFLIIPCLIYAKGWKLFDNNLEIRFNDETIQLQVKDKRCKKVWTQEKMSDYYRVKETKQNGNSLNVFLTGKHNLQMVITLKENSTLEVIIDADSNMVFDELAIPSAFITPDKNHYLLYTDSEGLLLPVDDQEYPVGDGITYFCGGGLSMAWMGMVDNKLESGYMAILDTPYDAALRTRREDGLITFSPVWLASKKQFRYKRKVLYNFFDKGGYVAQAKKYRDYIWEKNNVITLHENQKRFPAIDKMIGAVHIYVWDKARKVVFAEDLKKSGIDKAFILWDANHYPYPVEGYDNYLKELDYATGGYELFTDVHPEDSVIQPKTKMDTVLWLRRPHYPGKFHVLTSRKSDGSTYSNEFGHFVCPAAVRPEIEKRVSKELAVYPHEAYLIDVYQANGLYECYSEKHPLTRKQYAEEIVKNYDLLKNKFNVFLGAEWGADFAGSNIVFAHGMMTMQRTWWRSDREKEGTIYYYGNWNNNPRPSIMLTTRTAPDVYLKYSINEYSRIPLYELVYHDALVTSWRWEDANHHMPEIWWKKDLFNILYGTAPLWTIDQESWIRYKNSFLESYQNICPWLQQIGYDELVTHRFVTADRKVQESVFSSGKKVVVNFGDIDYKINNQVIKARGFLILGN